MAMTTEKPNEENIKCVIVGDNNVGKTRLVYARAHKRYGPNNQYVKYGGTHVPTVWANDHYRNDEEVLNKAGDCIQGVDVSLRLWDTFGDHSKNRKFSYGRADVIILCFSVCDPNSLEHVKTFWLPEARRHCKGVPVLIVACKIDLRFANLEDLNKQKTSLAKKIKPGDLLYPEICRQTANEAGCPYYETSICEGFGVKEVFENAIRASLMYRRKLYLYRNMHLRHVRRPLLQKPLLPPKPDPPALPVEFPENFLNFSSIYDDPTYSDIHIVGKNFRFYGHKVVLATSSEVFHRIFTSWSNDIYLITLKTKDDPSPEKDFKENDQEIPDLLTLQTETVQRKCEAPHCLVDSVPVADQSEFEFDFIFKYSTHSRENTKRVYDILELTADISQFSFFNILYFCYKGHLNPCIMKQNWLRDNIQKFSELFLTCQRFRMNDLAQLLSTVLNGELGTNFSTKKFSSLRKNAIANLILWKRQYSDIEFKGDDGTVPGHKAFLVCGSDVMSAMFGSAFIESGNKVVTFPETTVASLQTVFEYIYTRDVTSPGNSIIEYNDVIALANRLCLPELIRIVEAHIIKDFVDKSATEMTRDLHENVVFMLEVAQLHNAPNLAEWCVHHIVTNYNDVCKKCKMVKALSQENKNRLERCRWPPVWFLKDYDTYERACKNRALEENEHKGKSAKRS